MAVGADDVTAVGFGLSAMAYGGFATFLHLGRRTARLDPRSTRPFMAALWASALWGLCGLVASQWPAEGLHWMVIGLDLARYGLWFYALLTLLREPAGRLARTLRHAVGIAVALAAVADVLQRLSSSTTAGQLAIAAALALPLCGLLILEQLFRNLDEDHRWSAKPLCMGLACLFAYDAYLYSEALLFSRFDADALSFRAGIHALAVPFLYVAAQRGNDWLNRMKVSRAAAFYSATLVLAGGYLLFMAAVGYYVRYFGGNWGRALQLSLLAGGLALLGMLALSGSVRSRLRVFVGKHFFSYRYDYREEWLRFTSILSGKRSPQEMGELIVRGLAKMVECPGGSLWTRTGAQGQFVQSANWNMQREAAEEPADSALCQFLHGQGWVIDLDEFRSAPKRYGTLALPNWLLGSGNAWLVVPLLVGDELQGFVVLAKPLAPQQLNWEVLDLLKTAGRQAAGYLAQMQATEALLDARKFEAFNRMSAFVVHDLKNIVAQLSLMLKNAERLHDNREFQQDMLLTVESSLEKMRRLMLQLREGATPPGGSRGVELVPILNRLVASAKAQGRTLEVRASERLATRGHDERLERVLGHLVQNALDATPAHGQVWIRSERYSGQIQVEVGDTGSGMTEEFIRTRLFRPFNTTKHNGMGIGTYESFQYIRELGGSVTVDSTPGQGTRIAVLLPLFEVTHGSDLMGSTTR